MTTKTPKPIFIAAAIGLCLLLALILWPRDNEPTPGPMAYDNASTQESQARASRRAKTGFARKYHRKKAAAKDAEDKNNSVHENGQEGEESQDKKPRSLICMEEIRDKAGRLIFEATDRGCDGDFDNCLHFFYDSEGNRDQIRGEPKCDGNLTFCTLIKYDDHGTIIRAESLLKSCDGKPDPDYPANCFKPQYDNQGRLIKKEAYLCDEGMDDTMVMTYTYGKYPNEVYRRRQPPGSQDLCEIIVYGSDRREDSNFYDYDCAGKIDDCRVHVRVDDSHRRYNFLEGQACLDHLEQLRAQ